MSFLKSEKQLVWGRNRRRTRSSMANINNSIRTRVKSNNSSSTLRIFSFVHQKNKSNTSLKITTSNNGHARSSRDYKIGDFDNYLNLLNKNKGANFSKMINTSFFYTKIVFISFILFLMFLGGYVTSTAFSLKTKTEKLKAELNALQYNVTTDELNSYSTEEIMKSLDNIVTLTNETKVEFNKFDPIGNFPVAKNYKKELDTLLQAGEKLERIYLKERNVIESIIKKYVSNKEIAKRKKELEKNSNVNTGDTIIEDQGETQYQNEKNNFNQFADLSSNINQEIEEEEDMSYIVDIIGLLDRNFLEVIDVMKTIDSINSIYIPSDSIQKYFKYIQDLDLDFDKIEQLYLSTKDDLNLIPNLIGLLDEDKTRTYLLIFQNDNEMRSTGGLMTAYSYIEFRNGALSEDIITRDIYELDSDIMDNYRIPSIPITEDIGYYMEPCGQPYWFFRDSNTSLDLETSVKNMNSFYSREIFNLPENDDYYNERIKLKPIDGYIFVDTNFVQKLLGAVGEVYIESEDLVVTEKNFIEEIVKIKDEVRKELNDVRAGESKEILGEIGEAILEKISQEPLEYSEEIFLTVLDSVKSKHIQTYFFDSQLQRLAKKYNSDGRIERDDKNYVDYVNIGEANLCTLKMNLWVENSSVHEVNYITEEDKIEVTLSTTWVNNASGEERSKYPVLLGNFYQAWNQIMIPSSAIYQGHYFETPNGSITYPILDRNEELSEDLNKQTIDQYLYLRTKYSLESEPTSVTSKYYYELEDTDLNEYKLLVQKHPGKTNEIFEVVFKIDGEEISRNLTLLDGDKIFKLESSSGNKVVISDYNRNISNLYEIVNLYKTVKNKLE